jgi:hypothetical protein
MKRTVRSSVLAACLLVIAALSSAYAGSAHAATASIPFAFSVGTTSFPAGEYTINYEYKSGVVQIQGAGSHHGMYMTYPGKSPGNDSSMRLVFHRYDDQYFLSETLDGTNGVGLSFPVSKLEKEQMNSGSHSVADNSRQHEVVVLVTLATR